jgi:hypothetical protein
MSNKKSTLTVILVNDTDVSTGYAVDSNIEQSSKTEDLTTYGKNTEVYGPTLKSGACGWNGKYNDAVGGPRKFMKPLVGQTVTIKYRPEGTGSGLPQDMFTAVITKYTETAPVAGYRLFVVETQPSDDWDSTNQS